jgi:hypothetical protein
MLKFPRSRLLGDLRIDQVFEFYDFPRLFSASNQVGASFLAVCTFDDEDSFEWLYLPLSKDRLASVATGRITLFSAFTKPETGYLFKATIDDRGNGPVDYILAEQIPIEDLPAKHAVLNAGGSQKASQYGLGQVDPAAAAQASRRDTYNLYLNPPGMASPELSTRLLGNLLVDIQDLVDAIGQSQHGEPTAKGLIPAEILKQTSLNACQIFEGSFGLQLKGNASPDLLGNPILGNALDELMTLLRIGADEDAISNKLHSLKARVASKYRKLLKDLVQTRSPLKVEWGSPASITVRQAIVDQQTLVDAYQIVSRISVQMVEEITLVAELIGMDVSTEKFRVKEPETGYEYSGNVEDENILSKESKINGKYTVTLLKRETYSATSGVSRTTWSLITLEPIESESGIDQISAK